MAIGLWFCASLVMGIFCWLLLDMVGRGWSLIDWSFLTTDPRDSGRAGGIASVLVSTIWILMICLVVSVPIALISGLFLAEYTRQYLVLSRWVRHSLDVLASVPSIIFGLFGNAFFCIFLGMGYSILAGGLTLACMILPILIRATEQGFRCIPDHYRFGAMALGFNKASMVIKILLPMAVPAVAAGVVLGLARAAAETAALLFTSGYVDRMPSSILDSGRAISVHIYDLSMHINGAESQAYASALILLFAVFVLNSMTLWVSRFGQQKNSKVRISE